MKHLMVVVLAVLIASAILTIKHDEKVYEDKNVYRPNNPGYERRTTWNELCSFLGNDFEKYKTD